MKGCASLLMLGLSALAQSAPEPVDGKALFMAKCGVCHATDSVERRIGPSLKGLRDGKLPDAIGRPATHDKILKQIDEGGNGMPVFRDLLTREQKEAIVAYAMTL
jgi:cytochrome c